MPDTVVIGAGPGGLAAAASLECKGVPVVLLERDEIGASWRRHYDRLHLHTVRWLSHLPGYRFSRRHGNWVSRDGVVRYLERYARHHELDVRTGVEVSRIDPQWQLTTSDGPLEARCVVVATGYNRVPYLPEWPGRDSYTGELIHGQDYRNAEAYRGRDVLVVGSGNTGAEICVDLVEGGAASVRMAIRTPPNVLLRDVNGVPSQVTGVLMRHVPPAIADPLARMSSRLTVGDLSEYGIGRAPRGPFTAVKDDVVPILDVGLVKLLKQRSVEVVPALESFDADDVVLAGGERIQPDAVIACAGYRRGLEPLVGHLGLIQPNGRPVVHGSEMHPEAPDIHFIGYTNPISGMFREFGIDARRIARVQAARATQAADPAATTMG